MTSWATHTNTPAGYFDTDAYVEMMTNVRTKLAALPIAEFDCLVCTAAAWERVRGAFASVTTESPVGVRLASGMDVHIRPTGDGCRELAARLTINGRRPAMLLE